MPTGEPPERLAREAEAFVAELARAGTSARAEHEKRYLKSALAHLGVPVPEVRRATKALLGRLGERQRPGLLGLARELWSHEVHEARLAAIEALAFEQGRLASDDLPLLERFVREARTWALVDPLAIQVIGPLLARDDAARAAALQRWARDEDHWVRRTVLLAFLLPVRAGDAAAFRELTAYADVLLEDREFFVAKALGWVLREGTKRLSDEVFAWLLPRARRATRVTFREATRHLAPEQRAALSREAG